MPTTSSSPLRSIAKRRAPKRWRSVLKWAKRIALGLAAASIVVFVVRAWLPKPVLVDTSYIMPDVLEVEISEEGRTRVLERYVVSAPATGELERISLEAGDAVTSGARVAAIRAPRSTLLDPRTQSEARARLAGARAHERQASAAVARAKLARDTARTEADRARYLHRSGAISSSELERDVLAAELAAQDVAAAEQQHRAAIAEVTAANATLQGHASDTHVEVTAVAPADAKVLRVLRESAGFVAAGTPLVELGDPSAYEVVVDVLSRDAARIRRGMTVWIDPGDAAPVRGHVRLVEPSAFTRISALGVEEQRVHVVASVDAKTPLVLGDGFRVDARIVEWRGEHVMTVPASALFRDRGTWAVYEMVEDRVRLRTVQIGHRGRVGVELLSGVDAGARVVVHPNDQLADGTRVQAR